LFIFKKINKLDLFLNLYLYELLYQPQELKQILKFLKLFFKYKYDLFPIETATTSPIFFNSFYLIASSKAISQNGFIDIFTLFYSTPDLSYLTLILIA
jgi:hypothetical protein